MYYYLLCILRVCWKLDPLFLEWRIDPQFCSWRKVNVLFLHCTALWRGLCAEEDRFEKVTVRLLLGDVK
jgi:hypothetical protein